jgi:organic hydroperoxide reductase OsmC/OhrA
VKSITSIRLKSCGPAITVRAPKPIKVMVVSMKSVLPGNPSSQASSDAAYRGDGTKHNPEDLLVASLSSCHMLWYLHLAGVAGVVVTNYVDAAMGTLLDRGDDGRFTEVVLRPVVTITAGSDPARAASVHEDAHHACFIANSVNFPVRCEPRIVVQPGIGNGE